MLKALFSTIILLLFSGFLYSQNISISTAKLNYRLNDTIPLKLSNKSSMDLYYAAGIELNFENKWGEYITGKNYRMRNFLMAADWRNTTFGTGFMIIN
jgi:hypothetical protein